jgi:hypothetical protein
MRNARKRHLSPRARKKSTLLQASLFRRLIALFALRAAALFRPRKDARRQ